MDTDKLLELLMGLLMSGIIPKLLEEIIALIDYFVSHQMAVPQELIDAANTALANTGSDGDAVFIERYKNRTRAIAIVQGATAAFKEYRATPEYNDGS